jgi:hypothetical protein
LRRLEIVGNFESFQPAIQAKRLGNAKLATKGHTYWPLAASLCPLTRDYPGGHGPILFLRGADLPVVTG